jgi:Na+/H+ antiporter NhaC
MQQFLKFITLHLLVCTAQHITSVLTAIIRSSTTAVAAFGFTVGAWW